MRVRMEDYEMKMPEESPVSQRTATFWNEPKNVAVVAIVLVLLFAIAAGVWALFFKTHVRDVAVDQPSVTEAPPPPEPPAPPPTLSVEERLELQRQFSVDATDVPSEEERMAALLAPPPPPAAPTNYYTASGGVDISAAEDEESTSCSDDFEILMFCDRERFIELYGEEALYGTNESEHSQDPSTE